MNGYKLLTDAAKLIGIENTDDSLKIIGLPIVNSVLIELGLLPISTLGENIGKCAPSAEQAVLFGTAMLIANATGDDQGRYAMSQIYSAKRAALKGRISRVKNTFHGGVG